MAHGKYPKKDGPDCLVLDRSWPGLIKTKEGYVYNGDIETDFPLAIALDEPLTVNGNITCELGISSNNDLTVTGYISAIEQMPNENCHWNKSHRSCNTSFFHGSLKTNGLDTFYVICLGSLVSGSDVEVYGLNAGHSVEIDGNLTISNGSVFTSESPCTIGGDLVADEITLCDDLIATNIRCNTLRDGSVIGPILVRAYSIKCHSIIGFESDPDSLPIYRERTLIQSRDVGLSVVADEIIDCDID